MTTHRTALTEDQRRALCAAKVTLNGQPAAVSGWRAAHARVTDYATGLGAEWSWDAVAHVVEHNDGAFSSGPLVLLAVDWGDEVTYSQFASQTQAEAAGRLVRRAGHRRSVRVLVDGEAVVWS